MVIAMPVIPSAKKKWRQSLLRRRRNRATRDVVSDLVADFRRAPKGEKWAKMVSTLDKAAKKRVIHKNRAARLKRRLARLLVNEAKVGSKEAKGKKRVNRKKS